ncbi:sprouty-related, evh1 domain-containing protein 2 [Plakobranchus ocellatus]|uniref:Sprouty-related, evh1 domain-containing protein 2 n=1 Tax=Plakobranchus ocellatus TaxID=259542 RepID=A0AAV3ZST7_9GAST|nr:sprouty-related, evh1 domain-containing protein 2 [Plakobranchus ocellatus]
MIKGPADNGDYLVQVSAQVMTRDDSTGGWVPMGGGGLSRVRLCKLSPPEGSNPGVCEGGGSNSGTISLTGDQASDTGYRIKSEYVIQGERITDNAVILDCKLKKDIQYTKPNPKWHHWKTDEKRYGLTFERTEDAKAFDHGIRIAVADLTEGLSDGTAPADGDEGVFSYMDLPLLRKDSSSRSASTTSTTTSSPGTNSPPSFLINNNNNNNNSNNNDPFSCAHHLHRVHYIPGPHGHSRNVHTNGGNVYVGHHHNLLQQQQQQRQLPPQQLPLYLQQQQQQQQHILHHQHQQQIQPQQQIHYQNIQQQQQQTGFAPPLGEKGSPHKAHLDNSSSSPVGQELEEVWVQSSFEQQPSAVLGGKPSHPSLLVDCGDGDSDCPEHLKTPKESSYVVFNKSNKGGAPLSHEYSYPNLEPAQKPPAQRSSTKKQALGPSSPKAAPPSSQAHSMSTSQPYPSSHPHPYHSQSHSTLHPHNNPPLPIKIKSKPKSSSSSGSGGSGSGVGVGILGGNGGGNGGGGGEGGVKGVQQAGVSCRLVSTQVQCKHCRELFSLDDNPRGSCEDAPDSVARCLECVSCVTCAQCLMYHCWSDADGEFRHPCSCERGDPGLCKRWTALSFLSLLLPCLWCYLPFKACHHCGTACGLCGGRHKAA